MYPAYRLFILIGCPGLLATLLAFTPAREPRSTRPAPIASDFSKLEEAGNPPHLTLLRDDRQIVGWVGGKDQAGQKAQVLIGSQEDKPVLDKDNAFSIPYRVTRPTPAKAWVGPLHDQTTLHPPAKIEPSAFFITDRAVYRPEQKLHFTAFLRKINNQGEFTPLFHTAVEIRLVSEQKKTIAARIKTASDDQGRIYGDYVFTAADPLDSYTLSIPNVQGSARVTLAEYRKPKVHLRITGKPDNDKLRLRFEARDPLQRPAPARQVHYTAQLLRNPAAPRTSPMRTQDFAYSAGVPISTLPLEDLEEDQRLCAQAEPDSLASPPAEGEFVSQREETLALNGRPDFETTIDLPKEWRQSRHAVVVQATVLDTNGREERTSQTIPLENRMEQYRLSLNKSLYYDIDEPIQVTLAPPEGETKLPKATLVAMRMAPNPLADLNAGFQFGGLNGGGFGNFGMMPFQRLGIWQPLPSPERVKRTLATATGFEAGKASLRLSEPGAYKLIAIIEKPDGSRLRQENGCVVQPVVQRPALHIHLDRSHWKTGDILTGSLTSRFADARVLLTLRDSQGYRSWKTVSLVDGKAALQVPLPANLRHGAMVEAQYLNAIGEQPHIASQPFRVEPVDRLLTITSKVKPVVAPGDMVAIDLQVNRREAVDLVVSVYDQALNNIRPDDSIDPRAFFLADDRAIRDQAWELLRRRLGSVTVADLVKKARAQAVAAKEKSKNIFGLPESAPVFDGFMGRDPNAGIRGDDLVTLLLFAGLKTMHLFNGCPQLSRPLAEVIKSRQSLIDLLEEERAKKRLFVGLNQETFLIWLSSDPQDEGIIPGDVLYRPMAGPFIPLGQLGGFGGGVLGGMRGFGAPGGLANLGAANLGAGGGFAGFQGSPSVMNGSPSFVTGPRRAPVGLITTDSDQTNVQVRRDFSDSAFWNAHVRTNADGKATIEFLAPDSLTTWQVVVTAISKQHHVGRHKASFKTERPIMIAPLLPRLFTEGDKVRVAATVVNRSASRQKMNARLKVDNGEVVGAIRHDLTLEAGQSQVVAWDFRAGTAGFTQLLMSVECPAGSDASLKRLPVRSAAVEQVKARSGLARGETVISVPDHIDPKNATLEIRFAPTLAADLVDTLEYLVDYPYGCVEQTMSRFLPAILVAKTLKRLGLESPTLDKRLPACVSQGIKRLLDLQQADGGWGWNGTSQTHEMMTPYALYGLLAAEKAGYSVGSDQAIERGLERLETYLQHLAKDKKADFVYCLYVYGQRKDIPDKWWQVLDSQLESHSDYALALALELAVQKHKDDLAAKLVERLRQKAKRGNGEAYWQTAGFSRWGDDPLEITAVVLKALVAHDVNDPLIPEVLTFFANRKQGNRWNSTKDTALIVAGMCEFLARTTFDHKMRPRVTYQVNDALAQTATFDQLAHAQKFIIPVEQLKKGANKIVFRDATPGLLYRAVLRYRDNAANAAPVNDGIEVRRQFWLLDELGQRRRELKSGDAVPSGAFVESRVKLTSPNPMKFLLVENPQPAGCEVVPAQDNRFTREETPFVLREDREPFVAYHYEETPMVAEACYILHAEAPGEYLVPPARGEWMYKTSIRGHSGPFLFKVVDEAEGQK